MRLAHRLVAGPGHPVSRTLAGGAGDRRVRSPPDTWTLARASRPFWRERDRVLILGDVLFNMKPPIRWSGLRLPPAALTPDPALNLRSARRLAALKPDIVCFGHGRPMRDGAAFQRFIEVAEVTHR